jgi:predicted dehydrogenase
VGLDGYLRLLESKLDGVIITSPPYFHPEQTAAAIAAGKHVWCAKPIAVDVPGAKSFIESGTRAADKLSLFVDFQTRNSEAFLEVEKRIRRGDIGKIVSAQIYYQAGRLGTHADPTDKSPQARLRNWVFDKVLSGDIIVEQNVHVLDVSDWYLGQRPEKAFGTGGRKARVDVGDCWDHFIAIFWYPDGTRIDFSSGQYLKGYGDLCMRFYGTRGTADTHYGRQLRITGEVPWDGVEQDNTYREPVLRNAKMFAEAIRGGKPINNAEESAESTITTILGREASYGERIVTRAEILKANVKLEANLKI